MFRSYLMAAAGLILAASAALAQRASITSIDTQQHVVVVKVGEADYKLDADKIKLLDSDGKAAKLSDFWAKEKVMVTMEAQKITCIQKLKDMLAAQEPENGKVVSVTADKDQIVVKIGAVEHTAYGSKVKLLDHAGKTAKLSDFAAGDKVKITLSDGLITVIQLTK